MKWLTKYFNKKVNNEDLFLNHLKSTYDFDEACIIKKNNADFLEILGIIATSIIIRDNRPLGISTVDPDGVQALTNKILSECDYSIIKMSRNYTMSKSHHYALFSENVTGYSISFKYLTDRNLFSSFPGLDGFGYYYKELIKISNYKFTNNQQPICLTPSYSIRFPLLKNGMLDDYKRDYYVRLETGCRDLEVTVDIYDDNNKSNYCAKLFYGNTLLKEETYNKINDYTLFLDNFLFPYNLTQELIDELSIQLPLQLTPEFVKLMNKDFKLTIDMLKI